MTIVIDASVVIAWCFEDESDARADAALERVAIEGALAPAHWPLEVANALRTAERRGRLRQSDVSRLRELLVDLPVALAAIELAAALQAVLDAARTHELTAYDAAYLHLAAGRGLPIATVDDRLRRACERAGVQLVA